MKLRLFKVTYKEWNHTFSGKNWREMLAVGRDAKDAISRARKKQIRMRQTLRLGRSQTLWDIKLQSGKRFSKKSK